MRGIFHVRLIVIGMIVLFAVSLLSGCIDNNSGIQTSSDKKTPVATAASPQSALSGQPTPAPTAAPAITTSITPATTQAPAAGELPTIDGIDWNAVKKVGKAYPEYSIYAAKDPDGTSMDILVYGDLPANTLQLELGEERNGKVHGYYIFKIQENGSSSFEKTGTLPSIVVTSKHDLVGGRDAVVINVADFMKFAGAEISRSEVGPDGNFALDGGRNTVAEGFELAQVLGVIN